MKTLVVILFFILIASTSFASQVEYSYRSGIRNADNNNTEKAIEDFRKVIDLTEKDVKSWTNGTSKQVLVDADNFDAYILNYNISAHDFLGRLYIRKSKNGKDKKMYSKGMKEINIACDRGLSRACSIKESLNYAKNVEYFDLMKKTLRNKSTKESNKGYQQTHWSDNPVNDKTKNINSYNPYNLGPDHQSELEASRKLFVTGDYETILNKLKLLRADAKDDYIKEKASKLVSYSYLFMYLKSNNKRYLELADEYMSWSCEHGEKWSCKEIKIGLLDAAHKDDLLVKNKRFVARKDGVYVLPNMEVSSDTSVLLLNRAVFQAIAKNPKVTYLVNDDLYFDAKCLRETISYDPNGEGADDKNRYCDTLRSRYK